MEIHQEQPGKLIRMGEMEKMNHTKITEFIILGFFEFPQMQPLLFVVFLIIYLMSLTGNLLIIFTVCSASHLHSPMFFFLSNLSFLEICYVTLTVPKLLAVLIAQNKTIFFIQCMIQMYLFLACTDIEFYLLTAMAYDRYVAICNPLRYTIIMNKKVCIILATVSWTISFLNPLPHVILLSQSSFCRSNEINHFFCDFTALMTLSCSETYIIENITYIESPFLGFTPLILTIMSYVYIVSAVLKIRSAKGRQKAFSTCSSHLTVVLLFYGTTIGVYMRPKSSYSMDLNKLLIVLHITAIPLLNPLIYSLRNKELKETLWKTIKSIFLPELIKCCSQRLVATSQQEKKSSSIDRGVKRSTRQKVISQKKRIQQPITVLDRKQSKRERFLQQPLQPTGKVIPEGLTMLQEEVTTEERIKKKKKT
ncbi:olfactory receptor 1019-like [Microcaecilia unicolor]|uniref:Olfactory receptor 1019-like n=1 Tax=Microcaecilia unicolor TaxID=1415580 RepID=A0A6P7YNL1_9AMPH|nr:olfactory receptor 1019-like [Microcaecilia unicolor]